ncbi:MAG: AEC family transporter [Gammaproteobacteria bacterium]|nr:AEC family transporter [Gammaproteobacteria bacterium]
MSLLSVIQTILPVFLIVAFGYLYGRWRPTDIETANRLNMDIFTPALIFSALSEKGFQLASYQALTLAACLVVLGSGLLVWPLVRPLKVSWRAFLPPMMFTNSGNMGIPILLLAFGEEALAAAIVLFLVENTLHFTVGMYMVNHRASILSLVRTPMILASILGITVSLMSIPVPTTLAVPIDMLGQIAIPLMLFTLGIRMVNADLGDWKLGLWSGLLAPASGLIMALLVTQWIELSAQQFAYLMVFAALPPAVLNYMVAEKYNVEPRRVASIVFIANIMSVFSLTLVLAWVQSYLN